MNNQVYTYYIRKNFATVGQVASSQGDGASTADAVSEQPKRNRRAEQKASKSDDDKLSGSAWKVIRNAYKKGPDSQAWRKLQKHLCKYISSLYASFQALYANGARYKDLVDLLPEASHVVGVRASQDKLSLIDNNNRRVRNLVDILTDPLPRTNKFEDLFGEDAAVSNINTLESYNGAGLKDMLNVCDFFVLCWGHIINATVATAPMKRWTNESMEVITSQTRLDKDGKTHPQERSLARLRVLYNEVVGVLSSIADKLHTLSTCDAKDQSFAKLELVGNQNGLDRFIAKLAEMYHIGEIVWEKDDENDIRKAWDGMLAKFDEIKSAGAGNLDQKRDEAREAAPLVTEVTTEGAPAPTPAQTPEGKEQQEAAKNQADTSPAEGASAAGTANTNNNKATGNTGAANNNQTAPTTPKENAKAADAVAKCYTQAIVAEGAGQASNAQTNLLTDYKGGNSPVTLETIVANPSAAQAAAQKVENKCNESANETTKKVGDIFSKFFKVVLGAASDPKNIGQYNNIFKLLLLKAYWLSHYSNQTSAKKAKDENEKRRRDTYITKREQTIKKLEKDANELAQDIKNGTAPKNVIKKSKPKVKKQIKDNTCKDVLALLRSAVATSNILGIPTNCEDLSGLSFASVLALIQAASEESIPDAMAWMRDYDEKHPNADCPDDPIAELKRIAETPKQAKLYTADQWAQALIDALTPYYGTGLKDDYTKKICHSGNYDSFWTDAKTKVDHIVKTIGSNIEPKQFWKKFIKLLDDNDADASKPKTSNLPKKQDIKNNMSKVLKLLGIEEATQKAFSRTRKPVDPKFRSLAILLNKYKH